MEVGRFTNSWKGAGEIGGGGKNTEMEVTKGKADRQPQRERGELQTCPE